MFRSSRIGFFAALALAALLQIGPAPAGAEAAAKAAKKTNAPASESASNGVFTKAQASRGSKRFEQVCSGCHRVEDVKSRWFRDPTQQTVGDMFERIATTMPDGKPGSLSPQEYADIVAFVLKSKDFPPGDKELPADLNRLKKIHAGTP